MIGNLLKGRDASGLVRYLLSEFDHKHGKRPASQS